MFIQYLEILLQNIDATFIIFSLLDFFCPLLSTRYEIQLKPDMAYAEIEIGNDHIVN